MDAYNNDSIACLWFVCYIDNDDIKLLSTGNCEHVRKEKKTLSRALLITISCTVEVIFIDPALTIPHQVTLPDNVDITSQG